MQCTSFIPVYYHPRDMNGASGFSWHLLNVNANCGEQRGFNGSLPPSSVEQYLGYDKEVLRRIIQNHEATFRYQVQELHRLYQRQRDLMDDMRMREIIAQHLLSQTSQSLHCLSHPQSDNSQTSHTPSWLLGDCLHGRLPELTVENIQRSPNFAAENLPERPIVSPGPLIRKINCNEVKLLLSGSKESGKRILDLERPADANRDNEGKPFREGNLSEASEVTCNAPKKLSNSQPISDSETGDLSSYNMKGRKMKCSIDLNEPIQLESLSSNSTGLFGTHTSPVEIMHYDPCISGEAIPESLVHKHSELLNCGGSSDGINSSMDIDLNSMPVNCFLETETTLENLPIINKEIRTVLDCSSAHDHATRKGKCVGDNSFTDTRVDNKFLKNETGIDLNSGILADEHSPLLSSTNKSAGDSDLEGPASPKNEDCSSRGKSGVIQLETTLLSEVGEGKSPWGLDIIAAQTLFTILSSGVQENKKAAIAQPLGNFRNCLHWFADIVSSTGDDLENEIMRLQNYGSDNGQGKEKEVDALSNTSVKDHTRGAREDKDFETETLPSPHSLSEDPGFLETGSQRRNASRKVCAKPKKHSKLASSHVVKKSVSSNLKQPATRSKQGVLQAWGKIRKRQGGNRRRASKFLVIN